MKRFHAKIHNLKQFIEVSYELTLINKDKLIINNFIHKVTMFHIFIWHITLKFTQQSLFHIFLSYIRISTNI
jgi:hypothetical protein